MWNIQAKPVTILFLNKFCNSYSSSSESGQCLVSASHIHSKVHGSWSRFFSLRIAKPRGTSMAILQTRETFVWPFRRSLARNGDSEWSFQEKFLGLFFKFAYHLNEKAVLSIFCMQQHIEERCEATDTNSIRIYDDETWLSPSSGGAKTVLERFYANMCQLWFVCLDWRIVL